MNTLQKKHYSFYTRTKWWISGKTLQGVASCVGRLPRRSIPSLGAGIGATGYHLLRERREIALDNLEKVWGVTTTREARRASIKALFKNMTVDFLEIIRCYWNAAEIARMDITVIGREHLDKALEKGKGVIAVSAHLGNFTLMGLKLADQGYPLGLIFKSLKNQPVTDLLMEMVNSHGISVFQYKPRRVCARESIRFLKNNGIVVLLIDQNPRKRFGSYVEFFGYEIPTYTGPVVMAMRSGAALLPLYMHRNDDNSQVITILPEIELSKAGDRNTSVVDNLRKINRLYEEWITAYPAQWWWVHRRFRRARSISKTADNGDKEKIDCFPREPEGTDGSINKKTIPFSSKDGVVDKR